MAGLEAIPLERVLSSPRARCVQTVAPLAAARGITVESVSELDEGAPPALTRRLLAELAGEPCALCSHADVIWGVLAGLVEAGVLVGGGVRYDPAGAMAP